MSCTSNGFLTASEARLIARGDKYINAEICAIQQLILDAIDACSGGKLLVVINSGTPMTSLYGVSGLTIIDGGVAYIEDSPTVSVTSTGTGFQATPIIDPVTGEIISFNIINHGQGYSVDDVIVVTHASGITGTAFVGKVSQVTLEASFNDDFNNDFSTSVDSLTSGVNVGEIIGIEIINGGTNYFTTPHLTLIDPLETGSGFVGEITLDNTGKITAIDIVDAGTNYSAGTAAVIWGGNTTSALITVQTEASMFDVKVDAEYYFKVWNGLINDPGVLLQMESVEKYFRNKGYSVNVRTNPYTMNTIQWSISW